MTNETFCSLVVEVGVILIVFIYFPTFTSLNFNFLFLTDRKKVSVVLFNLIPG